MFSFERSNRHMWFQPTTKPALTLVAVNHFLIFTVQVFILNCDAWKLMMYMAFIAIPDFRNGKRIWEEFVYIWAFAKIRIFFLPIVEMIVHVKQTLLVKHAHMRVM